MDKFFRIHLRHIKLFESKISNLIKLLVPIFSLFSQGFSADFLEFLSKRRHLQNLKKSANKFIESKKFNIMGIKEIINSNFDLLTNFC